VRSRIIILALLAACGAAGVQAQTKSQQVFRCGPDGRTYSQTPCKDGKEVDVADPRSAEQQRAAAQGVKREQAMTEKMARERQAREAAAAKQGATHIPYPAAIKAAAPPPAASAATGRKHKSKPKPKPVKPA
jgi:hypothetical protein